ncbi:MAG TPA: SCO family protein [Rhizomicrobium sp.]|jgi:protein SCO1/2
MIRTPEALIPYMLLCACVAGGGLWSLSAQNPAPVELHLTSLGGPFTLTDQAGHRRSDADYRGRYVLLYFGYTNCPDVCPTTLTQMQDAVTRLGPKARRIVPVFVTIDPARDTPEALAGYLRAFGPRFVGLSGSAAETARIAKEYRVYYAKHPLAGGTYAMDHSGEVYLLGPDGRLVTFYDPPLDPAAWAKDLAARIG